MGDLGKLIVAKGFKKLPKVQKIARSGHTGGDIVQICGLQNQRNEGGEGGGIRRKISRKKNKSS